MTATICVPDESFTAYQMAWSDYAHLITTESCEASSYLIYYEGFDAGGQAEMGSSGWDTFINEEKGQAFCNPTPAYQSNVSYSASAKVSVRSNNAGSSSRYSNYNGSGVNFILFGSATPNNLAISNISLAKFAGNSLSLSFGIERYKYGDDDNTINHEEFKVYISGDGVKWSEVEYSFPENTDLNGLWNLATTQFSLKEVPETLSLCMISTIENAYHIDDIQLVIGDNGTEIDLSQGVELTLADSE